MKPLDSYGPPFSPDAVLAASGPLVQIRLGPDGHPGGARAFARIAAPPAKVWSAVTDVEGYAGRVPMIHRVRRHGERVTVELRFKMSLFSVGFEFVADVHREAERKLTLRGVSGEPRGLLLAFELAPLGEETLFVAEAELDVLSLGWLAKYFLKHHPEIEMGIFPGVALSLVDSMRRAAERR